MTEFLQCIVTGLPVGAIYALLALGFVLIYKSSSIINFAQGDMVMVGAFFVWSMAVQFGLPTWLSVLLGVGFAVLLGMAIERLALRPLIGQPLLAAMMATIAISILLRGVSGLLWGAGDRFFPTLLPSGVIELDSVLVSRELVYFGLVALGIFIVFILFFRFTKTGMRMRAVASDHQIARSLGISVKRVFSQAWIVAALTCVIAGMLLSSMNGLSRGLAGLGMMVFPAVVLGGLQSVPGALVGGLVIGIVESLSVTYVEPLVGGGFKALAPFVILMLVLLIKPYGLFGEERIERV